MTPARQMVSRSHVCRSFHGINLVPLAGLSRRDTAKQKDGRSSNIPEVRLERQATVSDNTAKPNEQSRLSYEQPFTPAELEKAMTRATLRAHDDGTLRNSMAIAAH